MLNKSQIKEIIDLVPLDNNHEIEIFRSFYIKVIQYNPEFQIVLNLKDEINRGFSIKNEGYYNNFNDFKKAIVEYINDNR